MSCVMSTGLIVRMRQQSVKEGCLKRGLKVEMGTSGSVDL